MALDITGIQLVHGTRLYYGHGDLPDWNILGKPTILYHLDSKHDRHLDDIHTEPEAPLEQDGTEEPHSGCSGLAE